MPRVQFIWMNTVYFSVFMDSVPAIGDLVVIEDSSYLVERREWSFASSDPVVTLLLTHKIKETTDAKPGLSKSV